MKRRHIGLALTFVSSALLLVLSTKQSRNELVEAVPRRQSVAAAEITTGALVSSVGIAALRSRKELFDTRGGGHHDLFGTQVVELPLPSVAPPQAEVPPLPPPIPPMPFTYIGKKAAEGAWEVYLARGNETLIVRAQTVIDSTYRVVSIEPPTLSLLYLPLNAVQTLNIGSAD
ncbi:hypothetical protein AB1286_12270 [Trinickia sp. NRRL B-1857]|uniref:hypothetical protein n=1 Tax=Trinickia sp. NRRL B-1857 TaxID=3162879 RepID=UPI003D2BFFFD